jgi:PAS domain-containing protein
MDEKPATAHSPRAARTRFVHSFVASAIVVSAAIVIGTAAIISDLRARAVAQAERQVADLALMLAEQIDRSLQAVELLEKNFLGRVRRLNVTSIAVMEQRLGGYDAHVLLKDTVGGLPNVASLALIDAYGNPVNSSRTWPLPTINIADRDYYKALASDSDVASFLSAPVHNRIDQARTIYLARKLVGPGDEFLGLVIGGLDLQSFEEQFRASAHWDGVEIAFVRTDGTLLARYPRLSAAVQRDDRGPLFSEWASVPNRDGAQASSAHDLAHFPARVSVSTPMSAALADWHAEALYLGGAATLLVIMIGGIGYCTLRQFGSYARLVEARTEQRGAEATRQVEEVARHQLDAAINNMRQGLVMFDGEARLVMCNKRYREMYALPPEVAAPGRPLRDIIAYRIERGGLAGRRRSVRRPGPATRRSGQTVAI